MAVVACHEYDLLLVLPELRNRASIRAARPRCRPGRGWELLGIEIGSAIDDPCRRLLQPEGQGIDPNNDFDSDPGCLERNPGALSRGKGTMP
jgi:hypothetical protein